MLSEMQRSTGAAKSGGTDRLSAHYRMVWLGLSTQTCGTSGEHVAQARSAGRHGHARGKHKGSPTYFYRDYTGCDNYNATLLRIIIGIKA